MDSDVALLAEGVDRNTDLGADVDNAQVALLAEGVDRNPRPKPQTTITLVALLAEGVDRNAAAYAEMLKRASRPPRGGRG